jgi:alginate O-acetyltransferase complex protein AlgI
MLFNSLEFLIFLPTVFLLYWFVFQKNLRAQNLLLLISSYVFYSWWDYRFLSLIFLSTVVDYFVGLKIHDSSDKKTKKSYLWISILFNLGLLGFFKYFNFFIDSWIDLLGTIGYEQKSIWTLNVILPVGISFYTFQTMSYSLDIYHGKLKPTKDFISFASFVSFFPQLVAGPIERASNLLPQILTKRVFKYEQGVQGLRLILYGMFKKVVIADSLAPQVDTIFQNYTTFNGGVLLLGLIYFSFQIYCDFSGYSDIAIGVSRLLGFELMSNFKFPYFSRDISEYWSRWHISLSSWFRDYLYIPLFSKIDDDDIIDQTFKYKIKGIQYTIVTFLVSGFWHGANWTFIIWGLIHGLLYIPLFLRGENKQYTTSTVAENKWFPSFKELFQMGSTFFLVMITWVFFRSESIDDGAIYLFNIITKFSLPTQYRSNIIFVLIFIILEWSLLKVKYPYNFYIKNYNSLLQWFFYLVLGGTIAIRYFFYNRSVFIYFQF